MADFWRRQLADVSQLTSATGCAESVTTTTPCRRSDHRQTGHVELILDVCHQNSHSTIVTSEHVTARS